MNPVSTRLIEELEQTRGALLAAVSAVPAAHQTLRPAPESWSVAEVLEHLTLVERRSVLLLHGVAQKAKAGLAAPSNGTLPRELLLDRSRKVSAAEAVRPTGSVTISESLQQLEAARQNLHTLVSAANEQLLAAHTYDHPAFGPLNFLQWVEFLVGHEARHTAQIVETAQRLQAS